MKIIVNKILLQEWSAVVLALMLFLLARAIFKEETVLMETIVVILAGLKMIYFLIFTVQKIEKAFKQDQTYSKKAVFLGSLTLVVVISYAIDYTCLLDCNPMVF